MKADTLGILLISGDHGRAHYAFVLASAAAAIGRNVVVFATNEGCRALLEDLAAFAEADATLRERGVAGLGELRDACIEFGVRLIACEAGLRAAAIDGKLHAAVQIAGAVTFLQATIGAQIISL